MSQRPMLTQLGLYIQLPAIFTDPLGLAVGTWLGMAWAYLCKAGKP